MVTRNKKSNPTGLSMKGNLGAHVTETSGHHWIQRLTRWHQNPSLSSFSGLALPIHYEGWACILPCLKPAEDNMPLQGEAELSRWHLIGSCACAFLSQSLYAGINLTLILGARRRVRSGMVQGKSNSPRGHSPRRKMSRC